MNTSTLKKVQARKITCLGVAPCPHTILSPAITASCSDECPVIKNICVHHGTRAEFCAHEANLANHQRKNNLPVKAVVVCSQCQFSNPRLAN